MIKSKFAFGNVYGVGVFLMAFLAVGIYFLLHPHMPVRNKFGTTTGAWLPGLIIVGAGLFLFYIFQKRITFLRIYPDRMDIKSLFFQRTVYKQDITFIDVWGREDIGFAGGNRPVSAIVVTCRDNEKYILADRFYRNVAALKLSLQENFLPATGGITIPSGYSGEQMPAGEEERAEKFAGYALLNLRVMVFVLMLGSVAIIGVKTWGLSVVILFVIFLVYYPLTGLSLFYVKVSNKYLIIRNHFFPWYRRGYRLEEIAGVVFEGGGRGSNTFRINMRNFHSKKYQAGSLRSSDWRALEQRLKDARVDVCNEL